MQRVLVINGILSLSIVSNLDPLSRCRYYWKNESIRCSCLRKSRWKWQCKIDCRRLCFGTLILNFTILIVATENPGCQPLCYQKDHCPRNAGCGPANSQCVTAQICPTGRRRQSPFLPLDAGLDHLVHHSTGTPKSLVLSWQAYNHGCIEFVGCGCDTVSDPQYAPWLSAWAGRISRIGTHHQLLLIGMRVRY